MFLDNIEPALEGSPIPFPKMALARQTFEQRRIGNLEECIGNGLSGLDVRGKRIAVTVGSRGIAQVDEMTRCILDCVKAMGGEPFIVIAMGSHGGATPEGQRRMVAGYGVTEQTMGVPIVDSMETVSLGETPQGVRVYCQKDAYEADGIIVVNKIKAHADFKGEIESGLCKMMVIGLGKHIGATTMHRYGFARMAELLEPAARLFLEKASVILGMGIIENAYDEIMELQFTGPEGFIEREKEMLVVAKKNIAKLNLPDIDILIIQQIGKDISGEGMDPNVTGRPGSYLNEGFEAPDIQNILVFGLTEKTHGNGVGIGMADITTLEVVQQLDLTQIYTNAITATLLGPARIPVIASTQKKALDIALRVTNGLVGRKPRVAVIKNTTHLDRILVSEGLAEELGGRDDISVVSEFRELTFSDDGKIEFGEVL